MTVLLSLSSLSSGKWHLGMRCGLGGLGCRGPQDHGFQSFFGLPFTLSVEMEGTHDFWSFSPEVRFNKVRQGVLVCTGVMLERKVVNMITRGEKTHGYTLVCVFLLFPSLLWLVLIRKGGIWRVNCKM